MSIYIQDDKSHTVRHYNTKNKIEKAVETLLRSDEELVYSETYKGYEISLINNDENEINLVQPKKTDVLGKIRAEITAISINGQVDEHTMFIRTAEQVKQMILEIIDKYKAESEG